MDPISFNNVRQRTISIFGLPRYTTIASLLRYLDRTVLTDLDILNNRAIRDIIIEKDGEHARAYVNLSNTTCWVYAQEKADKIAQDTYAFSTFSYDNYERLSLRMQTPPDCNWVVQFAQNKTKEVVKAFKVEDSHSSIYEFYSYVWGLMSISDMEMNSSGIDIMAEINAVCLRKNSVHLIVNDGRMSRMFERNYEKLFGNQVQPSDMMPILEYSQPSYAEIKKIFQRRGGHMLMNNQEITRQVTMTRNEHNEQELLTVSAQFQERVLTSPLSSIEATPHYINAPSPNYKTALNALSNALSTKKRDAKVFLIKTTRG